MDAVGTLFFFFGMEDEPVDGFRGDNDSFLVFCPRGETEGVAECGGRNMCITRVNELTSLDRSMSCSSWADGGGGGGIGMDRKYCAGGGGGDGMGESGGEKSDGVAFFNVLPCTGQLSAAGGMWGLIIMLGQFSGVWGFAIMLGLLLVTWWEWSRFNEGGRMGGTVTEIKSACFLPPSRSDSEADVRSVRGGRRGPPRGDVQAASGMRVEDTHFRRREPGGNRSA